MYLSWKIFWSMGSQWETHLESNYFFVLMIIKYYLLRIMRQRSEIYREIPVWTANHCLTIGIKTLCRFLSRNFVFWELIHICGVIKKCQAIQQNVALESLYSKLNVTTMGRKLSVMTFLTPLFDHFIVKRIIWTKTVTHFKKYVIITSPTHIIKPYFTEIIWLFQTDHNFFPKGKEVSIDLYNCF